MILTAIEDPGLTRMMGYHDQSGTRTTGPGAVHLSDLIKILMRSLQPVRFGTGPFVMNDRVEIGILFEGMLEEALVRKYATVRPAEIILDGVFMSPDGVNPNELAVEEYKSTYMSCSKGLVDEYGAPLAKFIHWFFQMMGYCKGLDVLRAILRVLYLAGDYSRPIGPRFQSYLIEFTQVEVDENWQMLLNVGREAGLLHA